MFLQILAVIIISRFLLQVVSGQQIQLFPYNETKNCKINLVERMDRIIMYGKVDLNGNIHASSVVNFEIKRQNEMTFQFISFLRIPIDCDQNVENYCSCFKTDDRKLLKLVLNITAFTVNSEAEIRAELVYRETSFYSEIRKLPIVYASETDSVLVFANDQIIHTKQTNVTLNDTRVIVLSTCREKFVLGCELELINLETETLLKSEKEIVVYNGNFNGTTHFKLNYKICNIQSNISFSITIENAAKNLDSDFNTEKELIFLFVSIALLLLLNFFRRIPKCKEMSKALDHVRWSCSRDNRHREELKPLIKKKIIFESRESIGNYSNVDLQTLPLRFQKTAIEKLLVVLSQLSCRVTVNCKMRTKKLGCGLVDNVFIYCYGIGINTVKKSFFRVCQCTKCIMSKTPSNTWGEIFLKTTFNVRNSTNSVSVLFNYGKIKVKLHRILKHNASKKTVVCVLRYVTCDQAALKELQVLQEERFRLEEKVQEEFQCYKNLERVYVSVTYTEQDTKYISTGSWTEKTNKDGVRTYLYDPKISSGNIGAPVVLIGYSHTDDEYKHTRNPYTEEVHCNVSASVFSTEIF
ncbi:hypothetical protein Bpfe_003721 [Biomphalaria pfeifferi]|uniref:Uncharacterized protein n=1 Tax=Biomphalaria pfeifferi TaxID=112525 RepID=A0AAD8C5R8_BIOPF|nr:hypothetical protein Bpfe_003721 [Biomphalaria pfeifferi]